MNEHVVRCSPQRLPLGRPRAQAHHNEIGMAVFSYFDNDAGWCSKFNLVSDPLRGTGMFIQKLVELALYISDYLGAVNVPSRMRVEDVE